MRVIVVGGGIGGLAAGNALARAGLEPLVLERSPELTEVGAGIGLAANALRALEHIGAADAIRARGMVTEQSVWLELADREHIFTQQYGSMVERYGDTYICAHRADLIDSLAAVLPPECVRVDANVVAVEQTRDGVTVRLQSGEELQGDVAVGADGLRSKVRTALFGEQTARFTGWVTWRCLAPAERVPSRLGAQITVWLGRGRHAMLYPIRRQLYNFSGFVPAEEVHRETWSPSSDVDSMRTSFEGACDEVMSLIDAVDTALITPLYFRDPLERWGSERITLLGDAAHPSPPSAGQGASMALEDAVTLAACLRRADRAGVGDALEEYAARRMQRTRRMLIASRVNLGLYNEADPVQARARNARLRGLQRLDPDSESTVGWLYEHDAIAAAEEPLGVPAERANPLRREEARRAFALWRTALTLEDRSRLWTGERAGYERFLLSQCPAPADLAVESAGCDGVGALWVTPPAADPDAPLVLHLHGGGYVFGSARASVELTGRLARAVGGAGLTVDYRLAPEHPHPAALEDALTAYRWLLAERPGTPILVSGECAGGALAVSLALALRAAGEPLPAAIHAVSPFCDLTITALSILANAATEPWLERNALYGLAGSYIDDADPRSPLISPLFADLSGLPPLLIHAAAGEALIDDATRLAEAARAAGSPVTLELVEDSVHSFILFDFLPEAAAAIAQAAALLERAPAPA